MKDSNRKFAENIPGKYYVTRVCIGCTLCAEIAPENFRENRDWNVALDNNYVCKQPQTPDEELQCREALDACPSEAIRDDGEETETETESQVNENRSCQ